MKAFDAPRWKKQAVSLTPLGLDVGSEQVMQYWERPLMRQLARYATRRGGRVLEVGFGLGVSADYIMESGCEAYCVIEPHPAIAERARGWGERQAVPVTVVEDFWQNAMEQLGKFDGVLFDTYPVDSDAAANSYRSFLPLAHKVLCPDGALTYYSEETRAFSPAHLALILEHFNSVEFVVVEDLQVPDDCRYWKHDHMVVPCLSRPRAH
jgi:guanidinoacetate N-methyltransferase